MPTAAVIASRTFSLEDQRQFAELSGDRNPIHLDPLFARRTQAGAPIVHGVHGLLWLLDCIGAHHPEIGTPAMMRAYFSEMMYLGEKINAHISRVSAEQVRAQLSIDGVEVLKLMLALRPPHPGTAVEPVAAVATGCSVEAELERLPSAPLDLSLQDLGTHSGRVTLVRGTVELAEVFPNAARLLGNRRIAALAGASAVVGMIVPGLHSLFGALEARIVDYSDEADEIAYATKSVDPRFRRVQIQVSGGGIEAALETYCRMPPTRQASIEAVAPLVHRNEFADSIALIVGGSRGLGECTAKLIAAGGGRVFVTYAAGQREAERLATEINAWGGRCAALSYDVHLDADRQLAGLGAAPTHVYYFATPPIMRRKPDLFDPGRLQEFNHFYLEGFSRLIEASLRMRPEGVTAFYPSTVAIDDRPVRLTEYAMSKAAGEILCADIQKYRRGARIIVNRLPRVTTDQTATVVAAESVDAPSVMLPIVRRMHTDPAAVRRAVAVVR